MTPILSVQRRYLFSGNHRAAGDARNGFVPDQNLGSRILPSVQSVKRDHSEAYARSPQ